MEVLLRNFETWHCMFNSCCHYKETEQKALGTLCNKEQHVFWPDSVWAIIKPNYCSFWKPEPLCHHSAPTFTDADSTGTFCTVKTSPRTRASAGCTGHPFSITQINYFRATVFSKLNEEFLKFTARGIYLLLQMFSETPRGRGKT